jgi:hypothetical protein
MLLIGISVGDYFGAAFHLARQPLYLLLLVAAIAQFAILISPAVYQRTRRGTDEEGAASAPLAGRPRPWMLPWGLLAGLVLTLLLLGQMSWAQVPGCGPPGASLAHLPGRCIGLARGAPLRFLYGIHSLPDIDRLALIKDWAQWSLVAISVFYALELLRVGRVAATDSRSEVVLVS